MFFVFNKQKIIAYGVTLLTVIFLFVVATKIDGSKKAVETSSENTRLLPVYQVKTEEKKVAFTMNCAWNADDIDSILETLKNNDIVLKCE